MRDNDAWRRSEVETKNGITIAVDSNAPHAPKLITALELWNEQLKPFKGGDISRVEYAT